MKKIFLIIFINIFLLLGCKKNEEVTVVLEDKTIEYINGFNDYACSGCYYAIVSFGDEKKYTRDSIVKIIVNKHNAVFPIAIKAIYEPTTHYFFKESLPFVKILSIQ